MYISYESFDVPYSGNIGGGLNLAVWQFSGKSTKFKICQNIVSIYCIMSINGIIMALLKYLQEEGPVREYNTVKERNRATEWTR